MIKSNHTRFGFPVGYHDFHKKQIYNFQLNRWHSIGFARLEDMREAGGRITDFRDWKSVMTELADKALEEERYLNAAIYYRSAEFYIIKRCAEKEELYGKFSELFYKAVKGESFGRHDVPYKGSFLPAIQMPSAAGKAKDTIVLHGGFDSFMEEWFFWAKYLSQHGFDVIIFEGPGQGAAIKTYNLPFRIDWEKPVSALLDYFKLDDVTLYGLSMGGWFCLRAAAFESRVKRVIPSGHSIDYLSLYGPVMKAMHLFFFKHFRKMTDKMSLRSIEKEKGLEAWMIGNLMYITGSKTPMEALDIWLQLNTENEHSELVTQDVLYLHGQKDHFVFMKMYHMQMKALINTRSLTGRVFTEREQAQNHCQIGNVGLALDTVIQWIKEKKIGTAHRLVLKPRQSGAIPLVAFLSGDRVQDVHALRSRSGTQGRRSTRL
ncbi:alpha/beta fold hydrolase [Myxococcota bacterium]